MAEAVERAYQVIRDGITNGAYPPGSHLTAQQLAQASGLSRTPVREAMRRLHAEGLVTFIPNRGAFVTAMSERDIQKIYDLRVVLESYAADSAALEASNAQIDELEDIAKEMASVAAASDDTSIERVAMLNNVFHKHVVLAAANPRLESALAPIVEVPLVLRTFQRYDREEMQRSMTQHIELTKALRARDGTWARSVMASHILSGRNALLQNLRRNAELPLAAEDDGELTTPSSSI
jgi:DNA-binding GntR family transcriptional regulator